MNHIFRISLLSICLLAFNSNLSSQSDRRFVAEWERAWGTLICWPLGIPSSLVVELAKDDSLYVLVANQSQLNQATNTFSSWGVNLNHTRFIFAATNSHWTRDWGPHFVFDEAGVCGIADPVFDGYPWVPGCFLNKSTPPPDPIPGIKGDQGIKYANDNLVNGVLATKFECPLISLPIYLTGGNVMVDGRNTAIATRQMLDENFPGFTEAQFRQIAEDSLGITNFIIVENPEINGIQHIDCYAKYLNETTILVKQVDPWNPEYACCEALASHLETELNCFGEPYTIIRIYCGAYSGNNTAAYTNSLILNNKVLVPLFSIPSDATAIQTYQDAMPGYQVIGFPWSAWYYYDALHCRTMGIFDFGMLYIRHDPITGIQPLQSQYEIQAEITAHSNAVFYSDSLLIIYSINGGAWDTATMSLISGNLYSGQIPVPVAGSDVSYYLFVADQSGRREFHPIIGQPDPHTFYAGSPPSPEMVLDPLLLEVSLPVDGTTSELINIQNNGPVPLNFTATVQYNTKSTNSVQVSPIPENYRTGSTTASAFTQTSLVRGAPPFEAGWMTFDISAIPVGSTINSIVFNGYVNATYWPYWNINPVTADPMSTTPSVLYNDIIAEVNAGFYLFREETSGYTTGWKTHTLGGNANADMEAALAQGWFAIGIIDRDFDESTYYIHFDGWAEANPPYLVVNYTYTVQQSWLTIDGGTGTAGSVPSLEDDDLSVGFDASGLEEGIYSANILIGSNDPVQPEVVIPVTLNVVSGMEAELKIWLEGPFEGTNMHTLLNQSELIPLSQPYAVDPWNYQGTESVAAIPNPDVVDWLLVEFYDSPDGAGAVNPQNMAEAKACFLLSDGSIVDLDGSSVLWLNTASGDDLFAVVRHRNHLSILTANPLPRTGNLYQLDFSTGENTVYGGQAGFKQLALGMWGMVAGDADADGQITIAEKTGYWELQSGETGYLQADHNLDGQVDNRDKNDLWLPNYISGYMGY